MEASFLQIIWFILLVILIGGYAVLDGFDMGVGFLSLFAKDQEEKRIYMNAIGPVWDGNEVWLLTAGGALFAAFPPVYATIFSGFYLAMMILLLFLMLRAVSFEFRSKVENEKWRSIWDWVFGLSGTVPAILYGVAVGNILHGVPIDAQGYHRGSFLEMLNPYSLLIGVLTLTMFIMQGAVFMTTKTDGELRERMEAWATRAWMATIVLWVVATIASWIFSPFLFEHVTGNPLTYLFLILTLASLGYLPVALKAAKYGIAFLTSSISIFAMMTLAGIGLFPRLAPSSIDLAYSLTITNSSSSEYSLKIMFIIALLGMPIVIAYTFLIYKVFWGKVVITKDSY
ncbi:cytochrome d ubiquinol oxidase subunit II [Myxococcota bacterium]|nr:cytochrome d ubiquinol oxidase subunit II [Myxococcota bacterium]